MLFLLTFLDAMASGLLSAPEAEVAVYVAEALAQVAGRPSLGVLSDLVGPSFALRVALFGSMLSAVAFCIVEDHDGSTPVLLLHSIHSASRGAFAIVQAHRSRSSPAAPGLSRHLGGLMSAHGLGRMLGGALQQPLEASGICHRTAAVASAVNALLGCFVGNAEDFAVSRKVVRKGDRKCRGAPALPLVGAVESLEVALLYASTLLQAFGWGVFQAPETAYLEDAYNESAASIRTIVASAGALGMFFLCLLSDWAAHTFGDRGMIVVGQACLALLYGALSAGAPWWLASPLLIVGTSSLQAVSRGIAGAIGALAPDSLKGTSVGLQHAAFAIGLVLGPFVGGAGYSLNHRLPFAISCGTSVLAIVLAVQLPGQLETEINLGRDDLGHSRLKGDCCA
eukprot:TRINITY_DN12529_c0_g1_i5.p1 TRINITY_DN12529_c0_g1~~TRINITY_DN12529_c0_g1_i5.p1  ORF type:complete len:396 (-),score=72.85 TRINITY_DN12529_c0_g1_i5:125-1312(-)